MALSGNQFTLAEYDLPLPNSTFGANSSLPAHSTSWPVLYVLTDKKRRRAYIGETNNYRRRMIQHAANPQKKAFCRTLLIDSPAFNQSATFDFENRLIELFQVDRRFKLSNRNNGYTQFDYYQRPEYRQLFRELWDDLAEQGYAIRPLEELENSDLFKYSPFKGLTADQYEALDRMLAYIDGGAYKPNEEGGVDEEPFESPAHAVDRAREVGLRRKERGLIVIEGAPGTGKTILAMTMLYKLRTRPEYQGLRCALVSPMDSLRDTLRKACHDIDGLRPGDVIGPSEVKASHYDVLLVDESHRLHGISGAGRNGRAYKSTCLQLGLDENAHQLDWILSQGTKVFLMYDPKQKVRGTGLAQDQLNERVERLENEGINVDYLRLSTQMRVAGGDASLDLVYDVLTNPNRAAIEAGDFDKLFSCLPNDGADKSGLSSKYEFAVIDSFSDFCALQQEMERKASLSRMMAGFAWDWASNPTRNAPADFDIEIEGIRKRWNSRTKNWVNSPNAPNEIGSIHTVQGYDLNYGFVIIGRDIAYDAKLQRLVPCRKEFRDTGAKNLARDADSLFEVIANAYYVLMTRGMRGTYLYVVDPEVRTYLTRFIPLIGRHGNDFARLDRQHA